MNAANLQFITFRIHGHLIGIDIRKVREINRVIDRLRGD